MTTPFGIASVQLASTPLPDIHNTVEGIQPGELPSTDAAIYLRAFLLNCQQAVKANEVAKRRQLKDALHAHIQEAFGEALDALIDEATDTLYEKLKTDPAEEWPEQEADTPDNLPLDFPAPEPE